MFLNCVEDISDLRFDCRIRYLITIVHRSGAKIIPVMLSGESFGYNKNDPICRLISSNFDGNVALAIEQKFLVVGLIGRASSRWSPRELKIDLI